MFLKNIEMVGASKLRFSLPKEIAEEHSAILAIMSWVEVEFERGVAGPSRQETDSLLRVLEVLGEHLQHHFAFEERGGVLRAAILALPDGQALYLRWKQQHADLLARVNGCLEVLRTAIKAGSALEESFHTAFRTLFRDLRTHEAFEDRLLGEKGSADARRARTERLND